MRKLYAVGSIVLSCMLLICFVLLTGCGRGDNGDNGNDWAGGPVVNSISPASGPAMTVVTIDGHGFGKEKGFSKVQFGDMTVGVKTWSDTEVTATVPSSMEPGEYQVTVTTDEGTSEAKPFTVK